MSRQTPRIPRFYIDYGQYLVAQGLEGLSDNQIKALQLNPTELKNIGSLNIELPDVLVDNTLTNYIAILGHIENPYGFGYSNPKVNEDGLPGWSLYVSEEPNAKGEINFNYGNPIGALSVGHYFDMPHAPDISLSISKEYDGVKQVKTKGGATLSNATYTSVPRWGDLPAWTLGKQAGIDYKPVSHSGRRTWKVSLSYIQDENMFNKHNNENQFFTYDTDDNLHTFDTSLGSFFGLTFDGQIPFLFCPDKDADNLEFAKCVITNKPTFKQVANNLFSTSLVLTEVSNTIDIQRQKRLLTEPFLYILYFYYTKS